MHGIPPDGCATNEKIAATHAQLGMRAPLRALPRERFPKPGRDLGKIGVAEGIENASQVAMLQSVGCRYGQGYFFGRHLSVAEMEDCAAPASW